MVGGGEDMEKGGDGDRGLVGIANLVVSVGSRNRQVDLRGRSKPSTFSGGKKNYSRGNKMW